MSLKILLSSSLDPENRRTVTARDPISSPSTTPQSDLIPEQRQFNWWHALTDLGHTVIIHIYTESTRASKLLDMANALEKSAIPGSTRLKAYLQDMDIRQIHHRMLELIEHEKPDLVILSDAYAAINATLVKAIKQISHSKIVFLNGTSPVAMIGDSVKRSAPEYDYIFCNDFYHQIQWMELGARAALALPISACNPHIHRKYDLDHEEQRAFTCDVCFVGAIGPVHLYPERIKLLEALTVFDLKIWTKDKHIILDHPRLAKHYCGVAYGEKMAKVIGAAAIAINSHGITMQWGGNMRTFEIPATGALQLIDRYDPHWFKEGEEIVSYNGPDDLVDKIKYYLDHDEQREKIAGAGQMRAYRDHTYDRRMRRMLETLDLT